MDDEGHFLNLYFRPFFCYPILATPNFWANQPLLGKGEKNGHNYHCEKWKRRTRPCSKHWRLRQPRRNDRQKGRSRFFRQCQSDSDSSLELERFPLGRHGRRTFLITRKHRSPYTLLNDSAPQFAGPFFVLEDFYFFTILTTSRPTVCPGRR